MTGQPFLGHAVKRQCGVLLIAAEGADEVRLRLRRSRPRQMRRHAACAVPLVRDGADAAAQGRGRDADRHGASRRRLPCKLNSGCRSA